MLSTKRKRLILVLFLTISSFSFFILSFLTSKIAYNEVLAFLFTSVMIGGALYLDSKEEYISFFWVCILLLTLIVLTVFLIIALPHHLWPLYLMSSLFWLTLIITGTYYIDQNKDIILEHGKIVKVELSDGIIAKVTLFASVDAPKWVNLAVDDENTKSMLLGDIFFLPGHRDYKIIIKKLSSTKFWMKLKYLDGG